MIDNEATTKASALDKSVSLLQTENAVLKEKVESLQKAVAAGGKGGYARAACTDGGEGAGRPADRYVAWAPVWRRWIGSGANPKELEELKQSNADLTRRLLDATTRESMAHQKLVDLNDQLRKKEEECKRREDKCVARPTAIVGLSPPYALGAHPSAAPPEPGPSLQRDQVPRPDHQPGAKDPRAPGGRQQRRRDDPGTSHAAEGKDRSLGHS